MSRLQTWHTPRTALTLVCVAMVVLSGVGIGAVSAQSDPGDPQSFYGSIESTDGTPAPEGTEVFALINGNVEDSIVIDQSGQYGDDDVTGERLDVNTGAGDEVVFTVESPDGPQALESPFDLSEADQTPFELDLTFPDGTFDTSANFEVTIDDEDSTLEAAEGDNLTVTAGIENTGAAAGTQTITATVGETEVGVEDAVSLDPDATSTVMFDFTADLSFDGQDVVVASDDATATAPLAVSADRGGGGGAGGGTGGGSDADSLFEVTELNPMEATVTQGDRIDVTATITNTGDLGAQQTVELRIDDTVADATDVTLGSGATETVVFADVDTAELDGEYEHSVVTENDSQTGSLTVVAADDDDDDAADDDDTAADGDDDASVDGAVDDDEGAAVDDDAAAAEDNTPGFGAGVALLAVLMTGLLALHRENSR